MIILKILYLITGLGGGGAEKVVVDLADQMVSRGHQVKIAYLKGEIVVKPKFESIELISLGFENMKSFYMAYLNYKKLLLSFNPDIVHAHMVHANIFARISRKFHPILKLICTAHSNNEGGKSRMLAYRFTHKLSELTTNVSKSASENFVKLGAVPENGILTIYNGIDLTKFKSDSDANIKIRTKLNLNQNKKIFLAVGRFHIAKDYPNLIKAFSILIKTYKGNEKLHLLIAGDGDQRSEIENLILDLNLHDSVSLLGRRNDIERLMSAADYFVLSSSFEGFGLVVAEAMACETFVIATDCGGVKEVVGGTGILISPKNSMALAEALMQAINMPKYDIIQNNIKALDHVRKNFDLQIIVEKWLKLYAN